MSDEMLPLRLPWNFEFALKIYWRLNSGNFIEGAVLHKALKSYAAIWLDLKIP